MTHQKLRGRVTPHVIRPLSNVRLGGNERTYDSHSGYHSQATGQLHFDPRNRHEAVRTAEAFNAAAHRCRAAARINAGTVGRSLDALAGHYAKRAASYFMAADRLPEVAA